MVVAGRRYQEWFETERTSDWRVHEYRHSKLHKVVFGRHWPAVWSLPTTSAPCLPHILWCKIWGQQQLQGVACPLLWCWYQFQQTAPWPFQHAQLSLQGVFLWHLDDIHIQHHVSANCPRTSSGHHRCLHLWHRSHTRPASRWEHPISASQSVALLLGHTRGGFRGGKGGANAPPFGG